MAAAKNDGTVAGGNADESAQVAAELEARDKAAEEAKDNPDYEASEDTTTQTVAEEYLEENKDGNVQLGIDGKTPVSFYNPAPKALGHYERSATRTDDKAERDVL